MNYIYYILIGVIVLVVAIDLYLKKKNRQSDSTNVDFPKEKEKSNNFLIISIVSFAVIIISFFSINKYIYDVRLTDFDDVISLTFGPSKLIDQFLKKVKKSNINSWSLGYEVHIELYENDLFPILYKILEIDKKNKFALYYLGYINHSLAAVNKSENLRYKFFNEAEGYGDKLLEFYPKYWGGYKILMEVNLQRYRWNKNTNKENPNINIRVMRSYATDVINIIGVPKNNLEKNVLLEAYNHRCFANEELDNYRAIYNDALYLSQIGEIFVDENKYLESKAFAHQTRRTKFTYNGVWDSYIVDDY